MVGQTLKLKNSDGLLHNVHALPKVNTPFNMAMPANRTEADTKFGKEEGMFLVKCDVHPWMTAYVGVFANPFFAVTGKDGKFSIAGLPPGTYEIEAWHEKLGVKSGDGDRRRRQAGHGRLRVRPAGELTGSSTDEATRARPTRAVRESHGTPTPKPRPRTPTPHAEHHEHHELGFWRKYVFSTDHKVIGIQYAVTGLALPVLRLLPDDADALAARLPRAARCR